MHAHEAYIEVSTPVARAASLAVALVALALAGCETSSLARRRRSTTSRRTRAPALELPPDLTTPQYDDRYTVDHGVGPRGAQGAQPKAAASRSPPTQTPMRKIVRAGNERWLVVKATPEQAWNTTREFWQDNGFVLAVEQPTLGIMETDWAENRADVPHGLPAAARSASTSTSSTTRTSATSSARGSSAATSPAPSRSTSRIAAMEQVPTGKIDNVVAGGASPGR